MDESMEMDGQQHLIENGDEGSGGKGKNSTHDNATVPFESTQTSPRSNSSIPATREGGEQLTKGGPTALVPAAATQHLSHELSHDVTRVVTQGVTPAAAPGQQSPGVPGLFTHVPRVYPPPWFPFPRDLPDVPPADVDKVRREVHGTV
ncbi:unnamed protein product [Closterium sp. NIES-64]|nr:unnamed protein product [Closterium sp. NIES-64]